MKTEVEVNEIVRLKSNTVRPEISECLLIVSKVTRNGIEGLLQVPKKSGKYHKAPWGTFDTFDTFDKENEAG